MSDSINSPKYLTHKLLFFIDQNNVVLEYIKKKKKKHKVKAFLLPSMLSIMLSSILPLNKINQSFASFISQAKPQTSNSSSSIFEHKAKASFTHYFYGGDGDEIIHGFDDESVFVHDFKTTLTMTSTTADVNAHIFADHVVFSFTHSHININQK